MRDSFTHEQRQRVYEDALVFWGKELQYSMLYEELGELMQVASKVFRRELGGFGCSTELQTRVAEEIADVQIMIEQLMHNLAITQEMVDVHVVRKLNRVEEMLRSRGKNYVGN